MNIVVAELISEVGEYITAETQSIEATVCSLAVLVTFRGTALPVKIGLA